MNREARVGLMFTIALIIFGTALYYLGSFRETIEFRVQFDKVLGLAVDSPVQLNGVPIGRVAKVTLAENATPDGAAPILVRLSLDRSARNHIRTSTTADIRSVGILGDKMILLDTSNYQAPLLEEDALIPPAQNMLDVDELVAQGTDVVTDITEVTEDLKTILDRLADSEGALMTLITDKELGDTIITGIEQVVAYLQADDNLLTLLLRDPAFAAAVQRDTKKILDDLTKISEIYSNGDGLAPALMNDTAYRQEVQGKIDRLLDSSVSLVENLNQKQGLLYRLTQDEEYGERVAANIEKASYHLASILEKIDEGDGSASLLVNDPSLYEGLYEVVYGVKHSGVTRWLIRKKRERGEELIDRESEQNP